MDIILYKLGNGFSHVLLKMQPSQSGNLLKIAVSS